MINVLLFAVVVYLFVASRRNKRRKTFHTIKETYGPLSCSPEFNGYSEIMPYLYEIYLDGKIVQNWVYANDVTGMVIIEHMGTMRHAFGNVKFKYVGDRIVN